MFYIRDRSPRSPFRYVRKPESESSPAFLFPQRLLDRKVGRAYYGPMGYSGGFAIQSELRELNERNYARLEAKLDRLIGEVRSEMRLDQVRGQMHGLRHAGGDSQGIREPDDDPLLRLLHVAECGHRGDYPLDDRNPAVRSVP